MMHSMREMYKNLESKGLPCYSKRGIYYFCNYFNIFETKLFPVLRKTITEYIMWNERIEQIRENRRLHEEGGGQERIDRQHRHGKLTVWERLECLLDEGTFVEINGCMETDPGASYFGGSRRYPGDGIVTGWGMVEGRKVCVAAEDFTVVGGTLGKAHAAKIVRLQEMAYTMKVPVIFLNDSGGARIDEGINALNGYGDIFQHHVQASGVIPQICAILGPCSGGACYSPALCDFVFAVQNISKMFITGPSVVESVLGNKPDLEELGGAMMHSRESGVVHALYNDERSCLKGIRKLLSYLPDNSSMLPPDLRAEEKHFERGDRVAFESIVPDNGRKSYDMHLVIENLMDQNVGFFEIQKHFAPNVIVGFSYLDGHVTGVVANQPSELGGSLDVDSSDKIARFVRFCDCFRIPLLTLVDVPAFLPGTDQERRGIIRHGAKTLYAYAEATVAKITVILRKAYGGAYIAMNSRSLGADLVYAWPIAEIAVMGAEGAVDIMYRKQINASQDPDRRRRTLTRSYAENFLNPEVAEKRGYVDEVILPEETRGRLIDAFRFFSGKNSSPFLAPAGKKHGNIPM